MGEGGEKVLGDEAAEQEADASSEKGVDGHEASNQVPGGSDSAAEHGSQKEEVLLSEETKVHRVQLWTEIRSSFNKPFLTLSSFTDPVFFFTRTLIISSIV